MKLPMQDESSVASGRARQSGDLAMAAPKAQARAQDILDGIGLDAQTFRNILESVPDGIMVVAPSGVIGFINAQVESLLGYRREELVGKHVEMLLPERYRSRHARSMAEFTADPVPRAIGGRSDLLALCKDGRELPVAISINAVDIKSHDHTVVAIRDVTESRRLSEAQRQAEQSLERLTESAKAVRWEADIDTWTISYISPHVESLLGYSVEQWMKPGFWLEHVHPIDRERVSSLCKESSTKGLDHEFDYRMLRADGRPVWFHDMVSVIKRDGVPVKLQGILMDISQRKFAEEQLHRKQEELNHMMRVATMGELAASIAHQINQPLSAIVNNARAVQHLSRRGKLEADDLQTAVSHIAEDGLRAGEVIRRLRGFLRKGDLKHERVCLNLLVQQVLSLLQSELDEGNISIQLELMDNLPPVSGDQVQLQQVVLNLILNGIESMQDVATERRELKIRTSAESGEGVCLRIQDSGKGIDAEFLEKIFDPFFTTKEAGLGMGLAINRSIIEGHGGRLWVTPNQDAGVTFCCTLPADEKEQS